MGFVVVRLGKDSVPTIKQFSDGDSAPPFEFDFKCKQVEETIDVGDYALIYLGSDNNQGIETAWKQGLRGMAKIVSLDRGAGFNEESTFSLKVISVFPKSLDQFDFLERSATLYKYFSKYPVIGIKSSRNNAVQRVRDDPRENSSALLTAIKLLYPEIADDLAAYANELLEMLEFIPETEVPKNGGVASSDDPVLRMVERAITERNELNFLFLGSPGTGKTWHAHRVANTLTGANGNRIAFLQFHPSIAYDDFVEGYSPTLASDQTSIKYEIKPKHFLRLCDAARADADNRYVMVIDEISRGDPSRVFGEMLTYIEPAYRDRTFTLGYSGKLYSVPANIIIIATANPYDRSVGEMDDAFLRRFEIVEFEPDKLALRARLIENGMPEPLQKKVLHLFDALNSAVPNGIGHAHFFGLRTLEDVGQVWRARLRFMVQRMLQFEPEKWQAIEARFKEMFGDFGADLPGDQVTVEPDGADVNVSTITETMPVANGDGVA